MINGLVSDRDDWSRLGKPFHVRCWEILQSKTLRQASAVVSEGKRSCSANFLLGQHRKTGEGAVVDMESAPEATCELAPVNGAIGHTNHFSDPQKLGVQQVLDEERQSTLQRYGRIQQLLDEKVRNGGKINFSVAQSMLRDHKGRPESICRHPNLGFPKDERYKTVVSIVMDLHDRRIWATIGSPCVKDYGSLRL
jgi:isopenicillin-N N-acyltransferase-like protein